MVPLIGQPFLYLLAIVAGTVVSAGLVVFLKGLRKTAEAEGTGQTGGKAAPGDDRGPVEGGAAYRISATPCRVRRPAHVRGRAAGLCGQPA
ncbi:hypothetical protein SVIOM342S_06464 [Streptomyces violaceorubidus]